MANISYVAGCDISQFRFIKQSASSPFTVVQATTGDSTIGVAQEGAAEGEPVSYCGEHEEGMLELGETVAPSDLLKPDLEGKGVKGISGIDKCGARALQGGVTKEIIRVVVFDSRR